MAKKPAPKPVRRPAPKPVRRPAPLDLVRNPNFDAAMAQQNYANNLQQSLANFQTQNPAQGNFQKSIRDAGKQIILSFEGETYGTANDKSANEIAKKYNLDIVQKPDRNSSIPVYIFSVKGEVDKSLSGIRKETGVKYADPNYRQYSGFGGPDPIYQYEDNRMKAALAGEEIPARPAPSRPADRYIQTPNQPISTSGTALPPEFFNLTPAYDVSKLISDYQAQKDAPGLMPIGQFSPEQMQSLSPERRMALEQRMGVQQMNVQQKPSLSQMQDYNRMLQQGIQNSNTMNQGAMANFANMQPGMQIPQQARVAAPSQAMPVAGAGMQQPGQAPIPRKFSTFNNTPARFG